MWRSTLAIQEDSEEAQEFLVDDDEEEVSEEEVSEEEEELDPTFKPEEQDEDEQSSSSSLGLKNTHTHPFLRLPALSQLKDLKRQLKKERQKKFCDACNEKPRNAVVIPCLHVNYCSNCLARHRNANSNTCPKCNAPIQGIWMSTFGASQYKRGNAK
ncbi:hypothetical protein L7F22_064256 [Adiantum nelumboides]|nr:hypothetical protein [Adiantum nelumboides]